MTIQEVANLSWRPPRSNMNQNSACDWKPLIYIQNTLGKMTILFDSVFEYSLCCGQDIDAKPKCSFNGEQRPLWFLFQPICKNMFLNLLHSTDTSLDLSCNL